MTVQLLENFWTKIFYSSIFRGLLNCKKWKPPCGDTRRLLRKKVCYLYAWNNDHSIAHIIKIVSNKTEYLHWKHCIWGRDSILCRCESNWNRHLALNEKPRHWRCRGFSCHLKLTKLRLVVSFFPIQPFANIVWNYACHHG